MLSAQIAPSFFPSHLYVFILSLLLNCPGLESQLNAEQKWCKRGVLILQKRENVAYLRLQYLETSACKVEPLVGIWELGFQEDFYHSW